MSPRDPNALPSSLSPEQKDRTAILSPEQKDRHAILAPEEEECLVKQGELAELQGQLADAELDLATLRAELKIFEEEYLRVVGPCLAEMESIKASAEGLKEDGFASESCATTEKQASFCPPAEMKSLFREVAKNIHPDLATTDEERRRRDLVMAEANEAYARGEPEKLRRMLLEWKGDPSAVQGDDVAARLIRVIRQLARARNRVREIRIEIKAVRASDLYFLRQRSDRATHEGRDLLAEMKANLESQIAQQRQRVAEMQR